MEKLAKQLSNALEGLLADSMGSVGYLQEGAAVRFYLQGVSQPLSGRVLQVTPARSHLLAYPQLASIYGGELATVENKEGELVLVDSYYLAKVEVEKGPFRYGQVGYIEVEGPKRSRLSRFIDKFQNLLWRESGF